MYKFAILGLTLTFFLSCNCQYSEEEYQKRPPPAILTHKQALNHDGNFKYLFTSENGLAQGESIAPDGTRSGGYSYIDPSGKKISLKYTAGKEGFKIIEADHLPKAPQPTHPLPAPQQQQAAYSQPQPTRGDYDDGQYRSEGAAKSYYQPKAYTQPTYPARPAYTQYNQVQAREAPYNNDLAEKEPEYNDEPGKAGTFGTGYLFEFGSG